MVTHILYISYGHLVLTQINEFEIIGCMGKETGLVVQEMRKNSR